MNTSSVKEELLNLREVLARVKISRSKYYRGMNQGLYPSPIKFGHNAFWKESDIDLMVDRILRGEFAPPKKPKS